MQMKHWLPLLLIVVLLCGCTLVPPQPVDPAVFLPKIDDPAVLVIPTEIAVLTEPTSDTAEEPAEPVYEPVPMPEFSRSETNDTQYCDVTPEALQSYIDTLCSQGFTCVGDEWVKYLYRSNVILALVNNTSADGTINLTVANAKKTPGGVTAEEVKPLLAKSYYFGSEFIMEQTPDELYEALGAQRFLVLYPITYGGSLSPTYVIREFLVAPFGAQLLYGSEFICSDVDADGRTELVTLGPGPTSGIFTLTLTAYEIIEGYPVVDGKSVLMPGRWGACSLTEQDANACLRFVPNDSGTEMICPFRLSDGEFQVDGMAQWGGSDYANLLAYKGLDLYVWQTDGEFYCGLLPSISRYRFEGELNALAPVTLERMKEILAEYPARPYLSFISRPSGSPVTFSEEQRKEIQERLFG